MLLQNKEDGGNRKFILVEQLQQHIDVCIERTSKVMISISKDKDMYKDKKLDFVYMELKKHNESFIERLTSANSCEELAMEWERVKKIVSWYTSLSLDELWKNIRKECLLDWKVSLSDTTKKEAYAEWNKLDLEDQKKALIMLLSKNHLYVNLSEIEDDDFECSEEEKKLCKEFYKNY